MPDYYIDPSEYDDDVCAMCGSDEGLVGGHGRAASRGGRTKIPLCRSCNSSMHDGTLKGWLRHIRDEDHWKWHDIVEFQKWKRTGLGRLVREVRDEW